MNKEELTKIASSICNEKRWVSLADLVDEIYKSYGYDVKDPDNILGWKFDPENVIIEPKKIITDDGSEIIIIDYKI